jgi:enterochelin esterase-like enzyme
LRDDCVIRKVLLCPGKNYTNLDQQRVSINIGTQGSDCGTEDIFLEENREFATHLKTLGTPHEYEEYPGGHDFAYWDIHVQEAIEFHKAQLSIQ